MNTLIITHNQQKKKFQWKKNYNPEELLNLLASVFKVKEKIIGLKDFRGKAYDISYFITHPKEALAQPYNLILEGDKSPGIIRGKSVEKNHTPNKNRQSVFRQKYLTFLETIFLENLITEKEFLFLKCIFFEEAAYVVDYFNEDIRDYKSFCDKVIHLLVLKKERTNRSSAKKIIPNKSSPFPKEPLEENLEETFRPLANLNDNRNVSIWVERILKLKLNPNDLKILNTLIKINDELLFSTFKVFENERDEEEMVDTVSRIIQKYREYENFLLQETRKNEEGFKEIADEANNNDFGESYFKQKKMGSSEKKEKTEEIKEIFKKTEQLKTNENPKGNEDKKKNEKFLTKENVVDANENNQRKENVVASENIQRKENNKKSENVKKEEIKVKENDENAKIPQKITLGTLFKDFIDETGDQFEEYELGAAFFLFKDRNEEMIKILKTCQSIELAVKMVKDLTNQYWDNLFKDNFTNEEIIILNKEMKESKNEEVLAMLQTFKNTSKIKPLLTDLKAFLEKKAAEENPSNTRERAKTGFSNIVGQRILEKKTSFNLMLHRNQSFQSDKQSYNGESVKEINGMDIKMINFGENAELKAILNKFHDKDDTQEMNDKYKETLKEIIGKADFIKKSDVPKYFEQLDSNNPAILDICSKYEKNKNFSKIKKNLINVLEKEDDTIDFQASPLMKNKVKKLNSFKYLIRELFSTKTITKKQEKLFFYLYMEEDMSILSAFEVYRITEDMQDFLETLEMIGKFHFFKTKLDFDEIEQFDEMVEKQLSLLFAYKRYLTAINRNNLEKIIRAGDISLLKVYQDFKKHKNKDQFINSLIKLAEEKSLELQNLEKMIKENQKTTSVIEKRMETIENFKSTKFLKDCVYFGLIDKLIQQDHVLISSIFEIYHNTKDKGDFIENIKLIYKWIYKQNLKELLKPMSESLKMTQGEIHFLIDCIDEDMPNIMGPYEFYMFNEQTPEAEEELKDTLNIILRVYKKEINIFEKSFYMANERENI